MTPTNYEPPGLNKAILNPTPFSVQTQSPSYLTGNQLQGDLTIYSGLNSTMAAGLSHAYPKINSNMSRQE